VSGEIEVGAIVAPVDRIRFDSFPLICEPLSLLAPARSRWSRFPTVRITDLEGESLILFSSSFVLNDRILSACAEAGFTPEVAGRSAQLGFILEMVRSGVGVALLPKSEITTLNPKEFAVCILSDVVINFEIELAWAKSARLSPAARKWIDMLKEVN